MKLAHNVGLKAAALAIATLPAVATADLAVLPPLQEPTIEFAGAGVIDYIAGLDTFTISGTPSNLFQNDPFLFGIFGAATGQDDSLFSISIKVGDSGNLIETASNADFQITGSIDVDGDTVVDFDGVLLQGHVKQFGARDGGGQGDDLFNFEITNLSGLLTQTSTLTGVPRVYDPAKSLVIDVVSEFSTEFLTPFTGSWALDFVAQAKGKLGVGDAAPPVADCMLDVEGKGWYNNKYSRKCRVDGGKTWKFWDYVDRHHNGHTIKRWTYGEHGQPLPPWASRNPHTNVSFRYVVTNTGTVPVSGLTVTDSFEGDVPGVPATLAVGQSVTLYRTVSLNEAVNNVVVVSGDNGAGGICGDTDNVDVKRKQREIRRKDYDNFNGKGGWDNNYFRR